MKFTALLKSLAPKDVKEYLKYHNNRINCMERQLKNLEMCVDFLIEHTRYEVADNIGFNGQSVRRSIFKELMSAFNFLAVVETGTYFGHTTAYLAELVRIPIYTSELNPHFYSISKKRLSNYDYVHTYLMDSREFIKKLADDYSVPKDKVFFYLDAHWSNDLPLQEEIDIICRHWSNFVIMIDDFEVPNDEGYGFDDYGVGKTLCLELIKESILQHSLGAFFPAESSMYETGAKRGCVVLIRSNGFNPLSAVHLLKPWSTHHLQK